MGSRANPQDGSARPRFQHRLLFLTHSLTDHHIGPEETEDGIWSIYCNAVLLAKLDYIIRG